MDFVRLILIPISHRLLIDLLVLYSLATPMHLAEFSPN
jgi:hypothetical protein